MERSSKVDFVEERLVAKDNLLAQARAIIELSDGLNTDFTKVVDGIVDAWDSHCLIVFSGVGKSGLVGRYLASCFNAIGVPSAFLSPSEAVHGDFGVMQAVGAVIALSVSGETVELKPVLERASYLATPTCLITAGHSDCSLADWAANVLFIPLLPEIDPSRMLPLKASLMQMALGNALVVAVAERVGFNKERLAGLHPGGAIGEALKESAG